MIKLWFSNVLLWKVKRVEGIWRRHYIRCRKKANERAINSNESTCETESLLSFAAKCYQLQKAQIGKFNRSSGSPF